MDDSIARFWDKYIDITKTYHIKSASARWYVMRVEEYIEANKGVRLTRHNADDISHYLQVFKVDVLFISNNPCYYSNQIIGHPLQV